MSSTPPLSLSAVGFFSSHKMGPDSQGNLTRIRNIAKHDALLAHEGRLLLEHATVLKPEDFFKACFEEEALASLEMSKGNNSTINRPEIAASNSRVTRQTKASHLPQPADTREKEGIPEAFVRVFKELPKEYSHERDMYGPIAKAINACLSGPTKVPLYHCFNTSLSRSPVDHGTSLDATLAPDLVITPDYPHAGKDPLKIKNIFTWGQISCEIKANDELDCGFPEGPVDEHVIERSLDFAKGEMILHSLRSAILGQFSTLPYRHVFHIGITGKKLRIWKFFPTGTQLTTAIDYTENPEPLIKFLMLVKRCPVSGIGLDVGEGRMFQVIPDDLSHIDRNMQTTAKIYARESKNVGWFDHLSAQPGYWMFQPELHGENAFDPAVPFKESIVVFRNPIYHIYSIASRATRCYLGVELSFLKQGFKNATDHQRLKHMHILKTSWQEPGRITEVQFNYKFFSRRVENGRSQDATTVATVLAGGRIPGTCHSDGNIEPFKIPFSSTSHNVSAKVLARIEKELQVRGDESTRKPSFNENLVHYMIHKVIKEKEESIPKSPTPQSSRKGKSAMQGQPTDETTKRASGSPAPTTISASEKTTPEGPERELQWILFDQVGGNLDGFDNVKELVQVMIDATKAHKDLLTEKILHRDLSANNIMIDLTSRSSNPNATRRGLLIDLDMAKDLGEPLEVSKQVGPEITGTLMYMSMRLGNGPIHSDWHEIESLGWVLLWSTIRHVPDIIYTVGIDKAKRTFIDTPTILDQIFRDPRPTDPLGDVIEGKLRYINGRSNLAIESCKPLDDALRAIKTQLATLYGFIEDLVHEQRAIDGFENHILHPQQQSNNISQFYYANNIEELKSLVNEMIRKLGQIKEKASTLTMEALPINFDKLWQRRNIHARIALEQLEGNEIEYPSHESFLRALLPVLETEAAKSCRSRPYDRVYLATGPSKTLYTGSKSKSITGTKSTASGKRTIAESEQQNNALPRKNRNRKGGGKRMPLPPPPQRKQPERPNKRAKFGSD